MHALRFGSGPRLVVAFHGYSNSAALFQPFEPLIGQQCTVYSFDLPGHGRTDWPEGLDLKAGDLAYSISELCRQHGTDKASLLAFSLGGRVALSLLAERPALFRNAVLAAPDGLSFNPFYYWVTRTASGRALFKDLLRNPKRYIGYLDGLRRRGLLDESRHRFFVQYLEAGWSRSLLQRAWPPLRYLTPSNARVRAAIRSHHVPVHLFMGIHDPVIPLRYAEAFAKGAPDVHLHRLQRGHRLLDGETISTMAGCLLEAGAL